VWCGLPDKHIEYLFTAVRMKERGIRAGERGLNYSREAMVK